MNNPRREVSPTASEVALKLDGLVKTFNGKVAVDHIDLSIPAGSMYGLVGPNGAGKTTTLMMAVGLLRPDSGSAEVFGADVWHDPLTAKRRIGLLPDGLALPERLTGREFLTFLGLLRELDEDTVAARAQELLSVLDLLDAESTLISDYSTGMRKKISLASALLHAPRLLVLDEPFEAVDPVSAVTVRTILERFVASGGSVVFSSHVMLLVEKLCSHVGVIVHGRVVASGTIDEVSAGRGLEAQFVELAGGRVDGQEGLSWLVS